MARKGNKPEKTDTDEKDTGSKRRYQSPQTPPQAPRSSAGTQQGRGQARTEDEQEFETEELDTESLGEGQAAGRGTSQEYGQGSRQGRGLTDEDEQGAQTGRRQDWQDEDDTDEEVSGGFAGRGPDFDLQKASRDELNAIAQELDIEDYESMNREELVMEIKERS